MLQALVRHAPLCLRVQQQPDQLIYLGAGAVTAPLDMLRYERITAQRRPACNSAATPLQQLPRAWRQRSGPCWAPRNIPASFMAGMHGGS